MRCPDEPARSEVIGLKKRTTEKLEERNVRDQKLIPKFVLDDSVENVLRDNAVKCVVSTQLYQDMLAKFRTMDHALDRVSEGVCTALDYDFPLVGKEAGCYRSRRFAGEEAGDEASKQ